MSIENACKAIASWVNDHSATAEGRDSSSFLAAAMLVATSDGPLDDAERAQLITLQAALTGQTLDDEQLKIQEDYVGQVGVDARIGEIATAVPDAGERGLLVSFAALMACAERGVNAQEGGMLQKVGQGLGLSHLQVQQHLGTAMNAAAGR